MTDTDDEREYPQITDEQFIAAMTKAVEENGPDYVYPSELKVGGLCQYTVTGKGACLIGKAIEIATGSPYVGFNDGANNVLALYGVSEVVQDAAVCAQAAQDECIPWGNALKNFEDVLAGSQW